MFSSKITTHIPLLFLPNTSFPIAFIKKLELITKHYWGLSKQLQYTSWARAVLQSKHRVQYSKPFSRIDNQRCVLTDSSKRREEWKRREERDREFIFGNVSPPPPPTLTQHPHTLYPVRRPHATKVASCHPCIKGSNVRPSFSWAPHNRFQYRNIGFHLFSSLEKGWRGWKK